MKRLVAAVLLISGTLALSGCYNKQYIQVSNLKYLNTAGDEPYVQFASGKRGRVHMRRDLILTLQNGRKLRFKHPYTCTLQPDKKRILITAKNHARKNRIPLRLIRSAAVLEHSGWYDFAYGVGLFAGLGLAGIGYLLFGALAL